LAVATQDLAYLTRAGDFSVDKNLYLVNPDGYHVVDTKGSVIKFNSVNGTTAGDFAKITKIDSTGAITYMDVKGNSYYYNTSGAIGTAAFTAGTNGVVAVVAAPDPGGLEKVGGTLFKAGTSSGVANAAFSNAVGSLNIANGTSDTITSNSLEASNVDMAVQFIKMIQTQRAYSANSKTITTADEMTQEVLNLKR
jgi:flagellar hook protein FlgE